MAYIILHAHGEELTRHDLSGPTVIGRSPECHVAIRDVLLSRRHCRIEAVRGGWRIVDLDSRNGTRLDDRRLRQHTLREGQTFRLGRTQLTFHAGPFEPSPFPPANPTRLIRPADPFEALAGTVAGLLYIDPDEEAAGAIDMPPEPQISDDPADLPLVSAAERYGADHELLIQLAEELADWQRQNTRVATQSRGSAATAVLAAPRRAARRLRRSRIQTDAHMARQAPTDLSLQLLAHVDAPTLAEPSAIRPRRRLNLTLALTLVVILATTLLLMCGWLVAPLSV